MTKSEFLTCLSGKLPYSADEINILLDILTETIGDGLRTDKQVRTPLGVFKTVTRKKRRICDISTGKPKVLPEREEIVFKPSKRMEY